MERQETRTRKAPRPGRGRLQMLQDPVAVIAMIAIVAITVIEVYAISQRLNGVALAAAIGAIGTIGGFVVRGHMGPDRDRSR